MDNANQISIDSLFSLTIGSRILLMGGIMAR
jgi:hypothetical protein